MQIGIVGLGRMGAGIARRLMRAGHSAVVFDNAQASVEALVRDGAVGVASLAGFAERLEKPRAVWLMVPAGAVDAIVDDVAKHLDAGDIVIDGGNSYYHDDIRRSKALAERGIRYLDIGVSGGVLGLERGYCLMIGGDAPTVAHLEPIFAALAPGVAAAPRTPTQTGEPTQAEHGYLYCGPSGAGHFVKMVHNGIEYGLMQAYAEGLNVLAHANIGKRSHDTDAETTPLRHPEYYQYDFDLSAITEVWRRGSVVSSFLLDLTASALARDPKLGGFKGKVSDSGEGRWTLKAAIDEAVPTPVLSTALGARFESRGEADLAYRVLSAMRYEFGGHKEKSG
jgi:6-phosphogluconate dehydrogenase